jgi:enterochelin esterase-like enzyme
VKSRRIAMVAFLLIGFMAATATAQALPGFRKGGGNQGKRQAEPTWLMPPIQGKNLHYKTFHSPTAGQPVSYLLYLPPNYEVARSERYPVVYWLHGIGGNQSGVPGFCQRLNEAIEAGKAPSMIFVFVNGMVDSFYCDAINEKRPVESVIMNDLIPHIDTTYRTIATRESRMIEGFSMGGFGAAHLGFKFLDRFGSISIIDGALLGLEEIQRRHQGQYERIFAGSNEKFNAESPFVLAKDQAEKVRDRTTIRMEVGALVSPNQAFHNLLDQLSIEHSFAIHRGAGHNHVEILDRLGDKNWEFYRRAFAVPKNVESESKEKPTGFGGRGTEESQRPREQTPSWLMPPVEGPNLHYKTFHSKALGEKVSYLIYLPPDYESANDRRHPVVYWLHGIGGAQTGVPIMAERLTKAISEGKAPSMIIVYVNGMIRSSYVDSADGKTPVETVSIKELIPHIDTTYRTVGTREGRMIEGFSMGGAGAAKWGFKFPELFGSISVIDGALENTNVTQGRFAETFKTIYGGEMARFTASNPWDLAPKNAEQVKGRTAIRIVTRTMGLGDSNTRFHELLDQLGIASELHKIPNAPHSPNPLYEGLGDKNWSFYTLAFKNAIGSP